MKVSPSKLKEVNTARDLLLIEFRSLLQHLRSTHLVLAWPNHPQPRAHLGGSPLKAVSRMQEDKNYLNTPGQNMYALQQDGQSQRFPEVFTVSFFL